MLNRTVVRLCVGLLAAILATLLLKYLILGGRVISLEPAPPLAGVISQSLAQDTGKQLPVAGKDFVIKDVHYLSGKSWAVATVALTDHDDSTLVLKATNGTYQVVLGPGTVFSNNDLTKVPPDVANYLRSKGLGGYESSN